MFSCGMNLRMEGKKDLIQMSLYFIPTKPYNIKYNIENILGRWLRGILIFFQ